MNFQRVIVRLQTEKSAQKSTSNIIKTRPERQAGVALVIVLAFVVLVTGLMVAFFSRALVDRQVSNSSASQTRVEIFAQGALDRVLADLKQEIVDGSDPCPIPATNGIYYVPKSAADVMPKLAYSTGTGGMENLLKVSGSLMTGGTQYHPGIVSTTSTSQNGRSISVQRWNKPLLMPPAKVDDLQPKIDGSGFTAPSWVLVRRDGNSAAQWNPNLRASGSNPTSVIGRYAFAIYNEGGLLDANVAGYPSVAATTAPAPRVPRNQTIYKTASCYADLTQIGLSSSQIEQLVAWRNYASASAIGTLGGYSFPNADKTSAGYFSLVNQSATGFMATGTAISSNRQSDRRFISRQELIAFLQNLPNELKVIATGPVFQNLSTFSRSLNQPSFAPHANRPKVSSSNWYSGNSAFQLDDVVNPAFRKVRVKKAFTRNDNAQALIGEPLVKSRFALNRLCWLTCEGPSKDASSTVRKAYLDHGISDVLLDQGTAENIRKYFGLTWSGTIPGMPGVTGPGIGYWSYNPVEGSVGMVRVLDSSWAPAGPAIEDVANMSSPREPNFFELLKAATHAGAIARGQGSVGPNGLFNDWQARNQSQVDSNILQLGANAIDQFDPDNFPARIVFNDSSANNSFIGVEDLPFIYGTIAGNIISTPANPPALPGSATVPGTNLIESGTMVIMAVPVVWNPHRNNTNPTTTALGPSQLRVSACGNSVLGTGTNWVHLLGPGAQQPAYKVIWPAGSKDSTMGLMTMASAPNPNTGLVFSCTNTNLYREPTRLMFKDLPLGSNLDIEQGNLLSAYTDKQVTEATLPGGSQGLSYIGFPLASGSLRWVAGGNIYTVNTLAWTCSPYYHTLSIEYRSGNNWLPYQQRLGMIWGSPGPARRPRWVDNFSNQNVFAWDPRSLRWPMMGDTSDMGTLKSTNANSPAADFVLARSLRWDGGLGAGSHGVAFGAVCKDMYTARNGYLFDADNTLRRPMGAYVPNGSAQGTAANTMGLPTVPVSDSDTPQTEGLNSFNRPIVLQRPYRSVAELGYVFSDTPWRNVDFFTPESGFSAFLDLFCISEPQTGDPLIAGKVDLNTRQISVLKALLLGTNRDEFDTNLQYLLTAPEAESIANSLVARTGDLGTAGKGPLSNISELVGRYGSGLDNGALAPTPKAPYDGFSKDLGISPNLLGAASSMNSALNKVQRFRESAIRALSDTGQAGTWNLLIDLVAQVGRYPSTATNAAHFVVEGEKRYWIHVAIDRQTARVIDQQIELVNE